MNSTETRTLPREAQTIFVTRHGGAVAWAERHHRELMGSARRVEHLTEELLAALRPGDAVVGTLPVHVIAQVCARGASFHNLSIDLPPDARGKPDLTAEEMERYGARLERFVAAGPLPAVAQEPPATPAVSGPTSTGRPGLMHRLRRRLFSQGAYGLLLAGASLGLSTWGFDLLSEVLFPPVPNIVVQWKLWLGLLFVGLFGWCLRALWHLRHTLFEHEVFVWKNQNPRPCRVLIAALSDLNDPQQRQQPMLALLRSLVASGQLSLDDLGRDTRAFRERVRALGIDPEQVDKLRWLTNLVAMGAHSPRLERVVLVPSAASVGLVEDFAALAQAAWRNAPGLRSRSMSIQATEPVDYNDYGAILEAFRRAARGVADVAPREICFDVTGGTKPIGIAGAVMTMSAPYTFVYVTNDRDYLIFDARVRLGEALPGEG